MCAGGVVVVAGVGVAEVVAEQRLVPVDLAAGRLGVGVEQQLGRVAAQPVGRGRTGRGRGSRSAGRAARWAGSSATRSASTSVSSTRVSARRRVVEEAQLDALGDLAEQREVGAAAVERRAQRVGIPGQISTSASCTRRPGPLWSRAGPVSITWSSVPRIGSIKPRVGRNARFPAPRSPGRVTVATHPVRKSYPQ